jgi:CBS domain-containing protein
MKKRSSSLQRALSRVHYTRELPRERRVDCHDRATARGSAPVAAVRVTRPSALIEDTMHVEARMTKDPIVCGAEDSLGTAASRMRDGDCGCLPVVDASGHVVGMLTDRDICMATLATGAALSEVRVADAMTPRAATTRPLDSLEDAERTMRQHRVRRLPVVDDQARVIGLLSCHDLFRHAAANSDGRHGLRSPAHEAMHLVATMVAIGRSNGPRGAAQLASARAHATSSGSAPILARLAHADHRLAAHAPVPPLLLDSASTFHLRPQPRG